MTPTSLIGIDISKNSFELWGTDERGRHTLHKRLRREQVCPFFVNFPPTTLAMEACASSQHWARQLRDLGHQVKIIPAQHVVAFRQGAKNDRNDARAIAEAASRPNMRTVPIKTLAQQDLQAMHCLRERLVGNRTALISEFRGLLMEYGIVCAKGATKFRAWLAENLLTATEGLSAAAQETFLALRDELREIDQRIASVEKRIEAAFRASEVCQRLATVPGVGPLTATALEAAVADPQRLRNGRHFAAYLGLVPRQHSTGGKPKLQGISKTGNCYLRKLLIHGARSVIFHAAGKEDYRSRWVKELVERRGWHKATVALANKNARVLWKLLTSPGEKFVAQVCG